LPPAPIALNLDWPGWASFFNDPKSSKVAGNVGVKVQPAGSSGKRTGWSGHHGFSVTESCANKEAAASLVWWLTNEDSQKLESAAGPLPTRSAVWDWDIKGRRRSPTRPRFCSLPGSGEACLPGSADAEWIEISNAVYPELQAAILGDKTSKQALDDSAAEKATPSCRTPASSKRLIDLSAAIGVCRGAAFNFRRKSKGAT
jgi:multiple sugar transport system substrate-binding protein